MRSRPKPIVWVFVGLCLLLTTLVEARSVTVIPKTSHTTLMMSNDNSYGYQVLPKNPLRIEVVGPGRLTLTVRLNSTHKRKAFQGVLEVRRSRKKAKKNKLKLGRARAGSYKENKGLHLSSPRTFRYKVPKGKQSFAFSLTAKRGVSLTVGLDYETQADQSSVQQDEVLALVPLVGIPKAKRTVTGDPTDADSQVVPKEKTTQVSVSAKQKESKVVGPPDPEPQESFSAIAALVPLGERKSSPTKLRSKPDSSSLPPKQGSANRESGNDKPAKAMVHTRPPRPIQTAQLRQSIPPGQDTQSAVAESASTREVDVFSIGLKAGQISPMQSIGSSTFTASVDIRYVLPTLSGRITLGVEASFHQYSVLFVYPNGQNNLKMDMKVIPFSLQMFYRMGLGTIVQPFVGVGADLFFARANVGYQNHPDRAESGSAIGLGGHVSIGLEAPVGPGFLVLEGRAGLSKLDLNVAKKVNVAGIASVAGYRLQF